MTNRPVTRLRPRTVPGYTDAAALNDIHALLTSTSTASAGLLSDLGLILARAGRPLIQVRDIEITIADTPNGRPVARTISAGITVTVRQEPTGPGLLIEITTRPGEAGDVTVIFDGYVLTSPHSSSPA
jgi:hypothetical protein